MTLAHKIAGQIGRPRHGGSTATLVAESVGIGLALSLAITGISYWVRQPDEVALYVGVFLACTLPISIMAGWAVLVDRDTIDGATPEPELSVESQWYDQAVSSTFHFMLVASGVACTIFTWVDVQISAATASMVVAATMMVVFGICYQVVKRREK